MNKTQIFIITFTCALLAIIFFLLEIRDINRFYNDKATPGKIVIAIKTSSGNQNIFNEIILKIQNKFPIQTGDGYSEIFQHWRGVGCARIEFTKLSNYNTEIATNSVNEIIKNYSGISINYHIIE